MKAAKRKRLERAGWRLVSTEEFFELTEEEKALVEIKLAQTDAERMKSSQSRMAKIETEDPLGQAFPVPLRKESKHKARARTRLPLILVCKIPGCTCR